MSETYEDDGGTVVGKPFAKLDDCDDWLVCERSILKTKIIMTHGMHSMALSPGHV